MSKDYDSMIVSNEIKRNNLIEQMESKKNEFIKQVAEFSKVWFQERAKREITGSPEIAKAIGTDRLKELKEELNELIDDVPNFISNYIDKEELWWHKKPNNISYYHYHKLPNDIDKQIRIMFGEKLGGLLSKDGFVKTSQTGNSNHTVWAEIKSYGGYGKQLMYPYSIDVPKHIIEIMKEYYKMIDDARILNQEIDKLQKEKEETNISDIWDSL